VEAIGLDDLARMIQAAADVIRANERLLSSLDAATGDGDHGTTICRVMDVAAAASRGDAGGSPHRLLDKIGWEVMCVDGGSTSPLLGSFFTGMSEGTGDAPRLGTAAVAAMFQAGLTRLRSQTKAQPGDKTLLDALVPAVDALQAAAASGHGVAAALRAAAAAADRGAQATKDMIAKFGRAKNLGQRTLGHVDPGATSIALLFQGFADALAKEP
jgi:phosphoenolpyruvate---glycerone phosphotransferase subunit DhaL